MDKTRKIWQDILLYINNIHTMHYKHSKMNISLCKRPVLSMT